jgi:hypothetical protein
MTAFLISSLILGSLATAPGSRRSEPISKRPIHAYSFPLESSRALEFLSFLKTQTPTNESFRSQFLNVIRDVSIIIEVDDAVNRLLQNIHRELLTEMKSITLILGKLSLDWDLAIELSEKFLFNLRIVSDSVKSPDLFLMKSKTIQFHCVTLLVTRYLENSPDIMAKVTEVFTDFQESPTKIFPVIQAMKATFPHIKIRVSILSANYLDWTQDMFDLVDELDIHLVNIFNSFGHIIPVLSNRNYRLSIRTANAYQRIDRRILDGAMEISVYCGYDDLCASENDGYVIFYDDDASLLSKISEVHMEPATDDQIRNVSQFKAGHPHMRWIVQSVHDDISTESASNLAEHVTEIEHLHTTDPGFLTLCRRAPSLSGMSRSEIRTIIERCPNLRSIQIDTDMLADEFLNGFTFLNHLKLKVNQPGNPFSQFWTYSTSLTKSVQYLHLDLKIGEANLS